MRLTGEYNEPNDGEIPVKYSFHLSFNEPSNAKGNVLVLFFLFLFVAKFCYSYYISKLTIGHIIEMVTLIYHIIYFLIKETF